MIMSKIKYRYYELPDALVSKTGYKYIVRQIEMDPSGTVSWMKHPHCIDVLMLTHHDVRNVVWGRW